MEGQVANLSSRNKDYAHELVTARGNYILIRVERKSACRSFIVIVLFGRNIVEIGPAEATSGIVSNNRQLYTQTGVFRSSVS